MRKIIVTGCNKGIGLGIVQNLASKQNWHIIMAVRNMQLGQQARHQLQQRYPNSKLSLQRLDISNSQSIDEFVQVIKAKYQVVDVLCNNAGVAAKGDQFDIQAVNFTFKTNFYGTIQLSQKLLPYIKQNGKIVTIGSTVAKFSFKKIKSNQIKMKFRDDHLTKEGLLALINDFQAGVADNTYLQKGWNKSSNGGYGISKLGIATFFKILSRNEDILKKRIQVYTCCPGFVRTDLTNNKAQLSVQQGVITPIFLIEKPFQFKEQDQGQFFFVKEKIDICPLQ